MIKDKIYNKRYELIKKLGIKQYINLYKKAENIYDYYNDMEINTNICVNTNFDIEYYSYLDNDKEFTILEIIEMIL